MTTRVITTRVITARMGLNLSSTTEEAVENSHDLVGGGVDSQVDRVSVASSVYRFVGNCVLSTEGRGCPVGVWPGAARVDSFRSFGGHICFLLKTLVDLDREYVVGRKDI